MPYDPEKHNRRSMRLKGYDYSQPGYYYVTICTQDRIEIFGETEEDRMILNEAGEMVDAEWNRIPERYSHVVLDEYKIMPNHLHGILEIVRRGAVSAPSMNGDKSFVPSCMNNEKPGDINQKREMDTRNMGDASTREGAETTPLQSPPTLGQIIARFKYLVSKTINKMDGTPGRKILQRGFHDHIIRNHEELNRIRKYIKDNPKNWKKDENNPKNLPSNGKKDS